MRYLIVTGQSGAGKTACVRFLEDKGSFCMDNMPPMMLPKLIEAFDTTPTKHQTVTIAVDVRSGEFFDAQAVAKMISELRLLGHQIEVIFMEASDETLLDRYKETRREHPLCQEGLTLTEAIAEERTRLQPLRETANYVIDTTGLTARSMMKLLNKNLGNLSEADPPIRAEVMSFGFKRGLPRQADLVVDVRFLPNPFYVESMRHKSGAVPEVAQYIEQYPVTKEFEQHLDGMIDFLIPQYVKEGKMQLVIAIGCTGGMHRSVFIAKHIFDRLKDMGYQVNLEHRDLMKNDVWEHVREER